jgi:hypothetical protein
VSGRSRGEKAAEIPPATSFLGRSGALDQRNAYCWLNSHSGWNEGIMHKLAIAVAVASTSLLAQAALACDQKAESAEQPQQKPAVAEKTPKQTKQQQKAKKADRTEKATVARADKG